MNKSNEEITWELINLLNEKDVKPVSILIFFQKALEAKDAEHKREMREFVESAHSRMHPERLWIKGMRKIEERSYFRQIGWNEHAKVIKEWKEEKLNQLKNA